VTEQELAAFLKARGWYLDIVTRRRQGKRFAYAKRREGKRVVTRYLIAESKLAGLTESDVVRRISS